MPLLFHTHARKIFILKDLTAANMPQGSQNIETPELIRKILRDENLAEWLDGLLCAASLPPSFSIDAPRIYPKLSPFQEFRVKVIRHMKYDFCCGKSGTRTKQAGLSGRRFRGRR